MAYYADNPYDYSVTPGHGTREQWKAIVDDLTARRTAALAVLVPCDQTGFDALMSEISDGLRMLGDGGFNKCRALKMAEWAMNEASKSKDGNSYICDYPEQ